MDLDPLQNVFMGSQLMMSAFSLFLFATYRMRFLAYFSVISLVPLANLMLRHPYMTTDWPLMFANAEGVRWGILCLGHGLGIHYLLELIGTAREHQRLMGIARWIGTTTACFAIITILIFSQTLAVVLTAFFALIYVIVVYLMFRVVRSNRTVNIYIGAATILVGCAFAIDYSTNFELGTLSAEMTVAYSLAVLVSFFLYTAANIVSINIRVKDMEDQRLTVEHRSKMATLGEVASSIAHEIKNPLAAISYANEIQKTLLDREAIDRDQVIRLNANIAKTSDQIKSIVDSLHSLSRNAAQDPYEVVDVKTIIERTLTLFSLRLGRSQIQFLLPRFKDDLSIECRETQVCQVLLNLLNNAFDAVQDLDEKWVRLSVEDHGDSIMFAVIDSGKGIPQDEREQILKSFYTTKSRGQGTGLGLNICKRIIDSHEGKLVVTLDQGHTRFEVYFLKSLH